MTDAERKALVERRVELAVSATFIGDEYPDVMRPKQTEQLYAMRSLIEADGQRIAELEGENARLRIGFALADEVACDAIRNGYYVGEGVIEKLVSARAALGDK